MSPIQWVLRILFYVFLAFASVPLLLLLSIFGTFFGIWDILFGWANNDAI